jgi:F-type H+-transporting ATPase subunit b
MGILLPNLAFNIINFLVMLWLLKRFLYAPILGLFQERQSRIAAELEEAQRVREDAAMERERFEAQIAEERRAGQDRLREAATRGEEAAKRRLEEANAEADRIVAQARGEAEQVRRSALAGLQGEIADLTVRAASRVLGTELDEQRHRQLIDHFLREELGDLA